MILDQFARSGVQDDPGSAQPFPRQSYRFSPRRVFLLLATLAVGALLGTPQAWATAAPTTITLTVTSSGSTVTSVAAGAVVTLTATVVSGSTPVNPGQVKFCDASAKYCEDSALLANAQLTTAGIATYKFRPGTGSHNYQAVFVGTKSYAKSSSATTALAVTGTYPTMTTLASSGSIGNYTLTATVVGTGNRVLSPTGEVSFLDTSNANISLGSAALGTATLGESFVQASTPDTNNNLASALPTIMASADSNGDGIVDLVTIHNGQAGPPTVSSTVNVLLGNGDGNFTLRSSLNIDYNYGGIAVGDFNGDGALDLAVINYFANSVTVLLGSGDGTFRTGPSCLVGLGPLGIAVGDFNGDGNTDIVVTNDRDGTLTVLLGKGDGTFTTLPGQNAGYSPQWARCLSRLETSTVTHPSPHPGAGVAFA